MKTQRLFIATGTLIILIGIATFTLWPFTNPWVLHTKIRVMGPKLVYGPLAYNDDLWETVLKGVRSGDSMWLQVAADLRPALDTHPGEEMLGAVSAALDRNPVRAIDTLIPVYGPSIVCSEDEEGGPISRDKAERREQLLDRIEPSLVQKQSLDACRQAIKSIINGK